ncbi:MAG: hypothetical protein KatS3mg084_0268 [Candidatus Dojkabacteria bacterium]|nr:MAG: hypothetical protein KatS3mg084_0268 [Candidatus Dojkabacteria bacterium]
MNNKLIFKIIHLFLIISIFVCLSVIYLINESVGFNSSTNYSSSTKIIIQHQNTNFIRILNVEIADEVHERSQGLMFRRNLENIDGMLFVFPYEANQSFWMKNTYIPLDIIFFDANKKFVHVAANAQPCGEIDAVCPTYSADVPVQYVLETQAGFLPREIFNQDLFFSFQ